MRKALAGVSIGLGAAAIVLTLAAVSVFETVELTLYDWRMRTVAKTPPDVHKDIVAIDICHICNMRSKHLQCFSVHPLPIALV